MCQQIAEKVPAVGPVRRSADECKKKKEDLVYRVKEKGNKIFCKKLLVIWGAIHWNRTQIIMILRCAWLDQPVDAVIALSVSVSLWQQQMHQYQIPQFTGYMGLVTVCSAQALLRSNTFGSHHFALMSSYLMVGNAFTSYTSVPSLRFQPYSEQVLPCISWWYSEIIDSIE